jgi:Tol biopolymer transport system component
MGVTSTRVVRPALLAAALALGCGREYGNPFAGSHMTVAPSAAADIVFTSNVHAARPGAAREVFAVEDSGANPTRLTFCSDGGPCSTLEASFSSDRRRAIVRRVTADTDGDRTLTAADGEGLSLVDFARSVEGPLLPGTARVSSVDWSSISDVVVFSAAGTGGAAEDLYRMDPNGQNNRNLTVTAGIRERHPRVDPTGSVAAFERIDPATAKGEIWVFFTAQAQSRLTTGGATGPALLQTPYVVGSDADPDYSPDGRTIVFRRLRALGDGRLGHWDLMTVRADGTGLTTIVTGPAFRDAPDWAAGGIVFTETGSDGRTEIVVVDADGSNRRSVVTAGAGFELASPRWLP